jgi:hypothetical protein
MEVRQEQVGGGGGAYWCPGRGGGAYVRAIVPVSPGEVYWVGVAAGGQAGGNSPTTAGSAGGTTAFAFVGGTELMRANGGAGGGSGELCNGLNKGGAGGTVSVFAGVSSYISRVGYPGGNGGSAPGSPGEGGRLRSGTIEAPWLWGGGKGAPSSGIASGSGTPGFAVITW